MFLTSPADPMPRIVPAVVESDGSLRLLEDVEVRAGDRALVTFVADDPPSETALLSEAALGEDWDRDAAWGGLA